MLMIMTLCIIEVLHALLLGAASHDHASCLGNYKGSEDLSVIANGRIQYTLHHDKMSIKNYVVHPQRCNDKVMMNAEQWLLQF